MTNLLEKVAGVVVVILSVTPALYAFGQISSGIA